MTDLFFSDYDDMNVLSFNYFGDSPEDNCWKYFKNFLTENKLTEKMILGFNNPSPSSENETYGYEFCVVSDFIPEDKKIIQTKIKGGKFICCEIKFEEMSAGWEKIRTWFETNKKYTYDNSGQWFEIHFPDKNGNLTDRLILCSPVYEK
ncbi:MAG TPA: GyrI-like domain-containing protein [Tepiditoga sp.]|nr:GyrI-like domain-containing protein [Thermotogota bacterium]HOO75915.1 GyrI-like domain-containing protein [Tepiditoga sp.]